MVKKDTLVLGVGNILLQDEGLGICALDYLCNHYDLPREVCCVDGGVMGLDLLPVIENCERLLILDAVECGQTPGVLTRLEGDALHTALVQKLSIHQLGLLEVLATSKLQGTSPDTVVLCGMQPASLDWGAYLTPVVSQQIPQLVDSAVSELRLWGLNVHARNGITYGEKRYAWSPRGNLL